MNELILPNGPLMHVSLLPMKQLRESLQQQILPTNIADAFAWILQTLADKSVLQQQSGEAEEFSQTIRAVIIENGRAARVGSREWIFSHLPLISYLVQQQIIAEYDRYGVSFGEIGQQFLLKIIDALKKEGTIPALSEEAVPGTMLAVELSRMSIILGDHIANLAYIISLLTPGREESFPQDDNTRRRVDAARDQISHPGNAALVATITSLPVEQRKSLAIILLNLATRVRKAALPGTQPYLESVVRD